MNDTLTCPETKNDFPFPDNWSFGDDVTCPCCSIR